MTLLDVDAAVFFVIIDFDDVAPAFAVGVSHSTDAVHLGRSHAQTLRGSIKMIHRYRLGGDVDGGAAVEG